MLSSNRQLFLILIYTNYLLGSCCCFDLFIESIQGEEAPKARTSEQDTADFQSILNKQQREIREEKIILEAATRSGSTAESKPSLAQQYIPPAQEIHEKSKKFMPSKDKEAPHPRTPKTYNSQDVKLVNDQGKQDEESIKPNPTQKPALQTHEKYKFTEKDLLNAGFSELSLKSIPIGAAKQISCWNNLFFQRITVEKINDDQYQVLLGDEVVDTVQKGIQYEMLGGIGAVKIPGGISNLKTFLQNLTYQTEFDKQIRIEPDQFYLGQLRSNPNTYYFLMKGISVNRYIHVDSDGLKVDEFLDQAPSLKGYLQKNFATDSIEALMKKHEPEESADESDLEPGLYNMEIEWKLGKYSPLKSVMNQDWRVFGEPFDGKDLLNEFYRKCLVTVQFDDLTTLAEKLPHIPNNSFVFLDEKNSFESTKIIQIVNNGNDGKPKICRVINLLNGNPIKEPDFEKALRQCGNITLAYKPISLFSDYNYRDCSSIKVEGGLDNLSGFLANLSSESCFANLPEAKLGAIYLIRNKDRYSDSFSIAKCIDPENGQCIFVDTNGKLVEANNNALTEYIKRNSAILGTDSALDLTKTRYSFAKIDDGLDNLSGFLANLSSESCFTNLSSIEEGEFYLVKKVADKIVETPKGGRYRGVSSFSVAKCILDDNGKKVFEDVDGNNALSLASLFSEAYINKVFKGQDVASLLKKPSLAKPSSPKPITETRIKFDDNIVKYRM